MRHVILAVWLMALSVCGHAQTSVPSDEMQSEARQRIEEFHAALLQAMRTPDYAARATALQPVIDASFDITRIAAVSLGRTWRDLTDTQQTDPTHDVVVIGGGPGGYAAALYGAGIGLDIGIIEHNILGGTCLNVGCIPAKELLETAHVYRTVGHAADFGVNASAPTIDWSVTLTRKQSIIDQLVGGLGGLLKQRKVTVYDGAGSLGPNRTVTITGADGATSAISAKAVVIAAGSTTRTIPGFEVDGTIVR